MVVKNIKEAKKKVQLHPVYKSKNMHIDGIQELNVVNGLRINLIPEINAVTYSYDDVEHFLKKLCPA